ncbi:MAG: B12-binding domain-containing radical SAM protein [Chloroflexi bacterium]|nr:B12-binding domain-containing radical SAM protein [Chloroflexota bacterium]
MRVALIVPPSPFLIDQKAFPPLGVLYLASALESQGVKVRVIDFGGKEGEIEEYASSLETADLYGLTATTPQYPWARRVLAALRKTGHSSPIVIGGAHPSSAPEECQADGFDCVVAGEGERAIVELASLVQRGLPIPPSLRMPYIRQIDTIAPPARHLLPIHGYGYRIDGGRATTLMTSRGCPFSCAFCSKDVWQRGARLHSVDYVLAELHSIIDQYGFDHFLFLDDLITINKNRLLALCEGIRPLGIKWRCYARADTTTKEMLIAMKDAGCIEVGVGIESGSQKILDVVSKGTTVERNTEFVLHCKEIGLPVNVFIMIGLPGETYETVEETRRWMATVRPDRFGFNIFAPYVGTPIHNHPERYDIRLLPMPEEKSWVKGRQGEYEAFVETSALSASEILRLFGELFQYYTSLTAWRPGVGKTEG